jgi:hypothetical protein
MFTRKAGGDKPIYLGTAHVLNLRPNTMAAAFKQ